MKSNKCKAGTAIDALPQRKRKALDAFSATAAAHELEGVGETTMKAHRAQRCLCFREDLEVILAVPAGVPELARAAVPRPPSGWSPRAEYDAEGGYIVTPAWADGEPEPSEAALLAERGMDPARWQVTGVRYSEWQQSKRTDSGDRDVVTLHAKRVTIAPRVGRTGVPDDDLVALLKGARKPVRSTARSANNPNAIFVHAGGDYQLGKRDGDGVEGTIHRFMEALGYGAERLELARKRYVIDTIALPHLGDCIEGYVSQDGRNRNRTTMATSEQVDLLIHLLCEQVRFYAPLAERIIVPILPGNHDEEARKPDGLEHHSWATFAAKQLRRTLSMAGEAYEHVRIVTPAANELTLTLDLAGTGVTMGHGHYHGPGKAHAWWAGQSHGHQLPGASTLLLEAHHHHLTVDQSGIKTAMGIPALEGESRWWRHRTGNQSPPGMVTMLVGSELGRPVTTRDGHTLRTGWDELTIA